MSGEPYVQLPSGLFVSEDLASQVADLRTDVDSHGVWQDYSPTYSGITVGNGTVIARYTQVGKLVTVRWSLTLGSTSVISGAFISPPVPPHASYVFGDNTVGTANARESGSFARPMGLWIHNGDFLRILTPVANAQYVSWTGVSGTVPHTWGAGDIMGFTAVYEAA